MNKEDKRLLKKALQEKLNELMADSTISRNLLADKEWASDGSDYHKRCRREERMNLKANSLLTKAYRRLIKELC